MTITAKIIADSVSTEGRRITTLQLRYPRFVHAEFMTHRMFSRNASSSRAIPVQKMIQDVLDDPAMPIYWGKNQSGMQAAEELDDYGRNWAEHEWLRARDLAVKQVQRLVEIGLHKQISNRVLEPWTHINVVVTATEWSNFFALRCHPAAQPEMRQLAEVIRFAMDGSDPEVLLPGDWHLPYVGDDDVHEIERIVTEEYHPRVPGKSLEETVPSKEKVQEALAKILQLKIKLSVARCASVSYKTVEGLDMTLDRATALYDRLVGAHPMHASPAEHQATPDEPLDTGSIPSPHDHWTRWMNPHQHGNFVGWRQFRKTLLGECQ